MSHRDPSADERVGHVTEMQFERTIDADLSQGFDEEHESFRRELEAFEQWAIEDERRLSVGVRYERRISEPQRLGGEPHGVDTIILVASIGRCRGTDHAPTGSDRIGPVD